MVAELKDKNTSDLVSFVCVCLSLSSATIVSAFHDAVTIVLYENRCL